jgi:hypothetical protein
MSPEIRLIMKRTRNIQKRIFAIEAAPAATPVKPKMAAIIAITRNIIIRRNMIDFFLV